MSIFSETVIRPMAPMKPIERHLLLLSVCQTVHIVITVIAVF